MNQKHLRAAAVVAVGIIIFHSIIFDALTNFLLAGALPIIPISLPSWMMFMLASIALVVFMRWIAISQLSFPVPRMQAAAKKPRAKRSKASRAKATPAS